jgi:fengycin family lipopeptide synthetase D
MNQNILDGINILCKDHFTDVLNVIIAVLNVVIFKITGLTDIVIASNIALRDREEIQNVIGFFVNTILIRNSVEGKKSFANLLVDVNINYSLATFYRYYTMSKLLGDLDIPFRKIRALFLNMLPYPSGRLTDFSSMHYSKPILGYFDIDLHIHPYSNGLEFICNYDPGIYTKEYITQLFDRFTTILGVCVKNPDIIVEEIKMPEIHSPQYNQQSNNTNFL